MRVFFALVAFVALAAAHHGGPYDGPHGGPHSEYDDIPELFADQHQYVYNYRSLVATGMTHQSSRYSGLEKYGVLTVQVTEQNGNSKVLGFRLGHVTTGSFEQEVEDIENRRIDGVSHAAEETIEKYGPVFVKYQNNDFQQLWTPQGMPEEVVNIYRGIAAIFTVGKPEHEGESNPFMYGDKETSKQPIVYRRYEQGITGNFETIYEVLSGYEQSNYFNVTKTRNYMQQVGRDGRYFQNGHDERGCQNICPTHKPERVDRNIQPETFAWDKPVAEGCPVEFHPKKELVEAYTTYGYNMTVQHSGQQNGHYVVIEEVLALDKKILPLRKQQIMTVSLVKLSLMKEVPISNVWQQQGAMKQYNDITYRFPEGHNFDLGYLNLFGQAHNGEMLKQQIIPMITRLAEIIVSDNLEMKGQTGDKIVQLTMSLGKLNKWELQALWSVLGQSAFGKATTDLEYVKRKVLIDTIGLSGSNAGAEFLTELIQQNKLTTLEATHTLETFQKNLVRPTVKIMNMLRDVCTEPKYQQQRAVFATACITFGEVVRANCGNHKTHQWQKEQQEEDTQNAGNKDQVYYCSEQEYKQYISAIVGQLKEANDYAQQTVYIQTVGRFAHPEAIQALIPYVYGEKEIDGQLKLATQGGQHENESEYKQFIRQVAIYALHHSAKHHGGAILPVVEAIYFNQEEKYEIRIAALSVLLATQPTEATFGRIVIELGNEHNTEVASYAYSALYSIANSTLPCMQQSARRVQNVLGGLLGRTYGGQYSKWGTYTKYFPLAQVGFKGHYEYVYSNVSAVPRFLYGGLTANKGPFVSTVGEIGLISKGFKNLEKFVYGKGGMNKIVENVMQRIRREARTHGGDESVQQMVETIEQAMQFNFGEQNEHFRAVAFGNVLGNDFYLPIDKDYINNVAKTAGEQMAAIFGKEGSAKAFRYVRVMMPRTYVQVAPGVNGLPVVLSNRHPIVVSMSVKDIQMRFGAEKGQTKMYPLVAAISGVIRPTIYHTSVHSVLVINPVPQTRYAYGVRAVEQTYFTYPIDVAAQYTHLTGTVGLTFRPRFEKVFYHKARAMTFKTEALLIRGADMPLLDSFTTLKTQKKPFMFNRVIGEALGMPLRVQGMWMNQNDVEDPFNSPVGHSQDVMTGFLKPLVNEWFAPRAWSVRIEPHKQKSVEEIKMVLRLGNLLKERVQEQQKGQQPQKTQRLSQEQLAEEQAYAEYMRMIAYEQEFERVTGRKPQNEKLEQALDRIVKKTQKYWSQVDSAFSETLNKNNVQVNSLEYFISAQGGKQQRAVITGHIILGSTLSEQVKLGEVMMKVENTPVSLEAQAVAAFSKTPQPFATEMREQEQRGIFGFTVALETPQTGKQQYTGAMEMAKSEEQKQLMKLPVQLKPWYHRQCEEDKSAGKSEMSSACEIARYHKSALNQLRLEVDLPPQIPESLVNLSHQLRDALKVGLYRNLYVNYGPRNSGTQKNKLQAILVCSERNPEMRMVNLTIRTPDHEELRFERITIPKALRPNAMWSIKQQIKAFAKIDRPEPTCVYNGQHVRTFDNVTVSLSPMKPGQKYIITHDNDEDPKFTLLAQKMQSTHDGATELEMILRGVTFVKISPPDHQGHYNVHVNRTDLEVTTKQVAIQQYAGQTGHLITFHVEEHDEGQSTLVVEVRDQRMRIVYDGKNFKVEFGDRQHKGHLSGLCGDMNFQKVDEFTGPRGCNYERVEDFVRAFGLDNDGKQPQGDWNCPEGVYPRGATQKQILQKNEAKKMMQQQQKFISEQRETLRQEHDQLTEETKMIPLGGKICFSLEPIQACKQGLRQLQSEMQSVAFTCLKANSQRTIQLQREIQTQKVALSLPVASTRSSNLVHHEIEVATRCSP
ncbi:vitellogenin 2-like [Tropilaelaps mercedesae]|uniref:Vitellogenin 2-like n=1 Tax=Tropilaelaps mercedesae TaxID=418985 RepID=A0A1V9X1H5_9ACAR|nr:vitellogenin 2-like [Tropilaelaps mercedesae]